MKQNAGFICKSGDFMRSLVAVSEQTVKEMLCWLLFAKQVLTYRCVLVVVCCPSGGSLRKAGWLCLNGGS